MAKGFTEEDVSDQSGKTAFVTGANTGLGFHVARVLADRGARVLLGCRSQEKALMAMEKILAANPDADIAFVPLDLGDLASIEEAAAMVATEDQLDLLINNAGIMFPPFELTKDGFESQFGVNHLGPFALTGFLIDKILETPEARIVSTSSLGHRPGQIYFNDIHAEQSYNPQFRYFQSKLANLLFAYELERRLRKLETNVISVACHPGAADTELSRHLPFFARAVTPVVSLIANTAAQGAWPTLLAATGDEVDGGGYYGPSGIGEFSGSAVKVSSTRRSHDRTMAKRLWDLSIDLTGVDPGL